VEIALLIGHPIVKPAMRLDDKIRHTGISSLSDATSALDSFANAARHSGGIF
jgi:hypothetical protein